MRLHVNNLKWLGGGAAEVRAGYWFPTKFAGEGHFADHQVVWQEGHWVVASVTNETMS